MFILTNGSFKDGIEIQTKWVVTGSLIDKDLAFARNQHNMPLQILDRQCMNAIKTET